jgi:hypothetical protein
MITRRLVPILSALLLAASALAQFTREQKQEVLDQMDKVLAQEAFVPGVELGQWRTFLAKRQDRLDETESPYEFAGLVNGALSEFGLSHIQLSRERTRRRFGGETAKALQGFGPRGRAASMRWLDEESALIRVPTFDTGYDAGGIEELFEMAKDAKYMVVDLRSNPGGEVENMRHFLGLVLPSETPVGTFVSRRMSREFVRAGKGDGKDPIAIAKWADRKFGPRRVSVKPFSGDVAVLVDGRSASASEIVANALREVKKSPLVGSKTAGAVLMSTFGRLPYGFRIQYPVSDYVSRDGKRLEGHPLTPDISAPYDGDASAAAERALAKLKGEKTLGLFLVLPTAA